MRSCEKHSDSGNIIRAAATETPSSIKRDRFFYIVSLPALFPAYQSHPIIKLSKSGGYCCGFIKALPPLRNAPCSSSACCNCFARVACLRVHTSTSYIRPDCSLYRNIGRAPSVPRLEINAATISPIPSFATTGKFYFHALAESSTRQILNLTKTFRELSQNNIQTINNI